MNLLHCPRCSLPITRPHTLHCGHSICLDHLLTSTRCPVPECSVAPGPAPLQLPSSSRVAYFPAPILPAPDPEAEEEDLEPDASTRGIDVTAARVLQSVHELVELDSRGGPSPISRPRKRRKRSTSSDGSEDDSDLLAHLQTMSGLQSDVPRDRPLLSTDLSQSADTRRSRCRKELLSNLTCEICLTMLYQPMTTPCQHVSSTPR